MRTRHKRSNDRTPGDCLEQTLDFTPLELTQNNQTIGGFLLSKARSRRHPQITFVFEAAGYHSAVEEAASGPLLQKLGRILTALPLGERLTIHGSKYADDRDRQNELNELAQFSQNQIAKLCLYSEKARIQQLSEQGQRQQFKLYLYATWSLVSPHQAEGHLEPLLSLVEQALVPLQPDTVAHQQPELAPLLQRAFEGYQVWLTVLEAELGVRSLSAAECMQVVGRCFQYPNVPLSHCVYVNEQGIREVATSERSPITLLTRKAQPEPQPRYVRLNDRYVGALTMLDKPGGWESAQHQLTNLFAVMARPDVKDTDLFVEFTPGDRKRQHLSLQVVNRQANTRFERAGEQNATDVTAMVKAEETVAAQRALISGDSTVKVGCAVLIKRERLAALDMACNRLVRSLPWLAREVHLAHEVFLQTRPITATPLQQFGVFDQRLLYLTSEATGLMPVLKPRVHDQGGLELIAAAGSCPLYINFLAPHPLYGARHGGIFGQTRSGKSVLGTSILVSAVAKGLPVTVVDYPKPDGTSTFTDLTNLLGGAYFDVTQESLNIFDIPDLSGFSEAEQAQRLGQYRRNLLVLLIVLVCGDTSSDQLPGGRDSIKAVLQLALVEFFRDACIMARYREAHRDGLGSAAWQAMPTMHDFVALLEPDVLALEGADASSTLAYIKLQLRSWLHSPGVGQAISRPSTIQSEASLVVLALTNVSDATEMQVMALSANLLALQRSLSHEASLLFMDEAAILFQFDAVSQMVGRLYANGGKAGIRVIVSGQDPDTIAESVAGAQILQNMSVKLIGRIQSAAVKSFERYLGIPAAVMQENADASFLPNPQGMYSNWLVVEGGTTTRCRFYPSAILLALAANNPHEQRARSLVLAAFQSEPLQGLAVFAELLTRSIQSGTALDRIVADWQESHPTDAL
jgi:hypothetical protein